MKSNRIMLVGIFMLVMYNCFDWASYTYDNIVTAKICVYGSIAFGILSFVVFACGFVMSFFENKKSNKQLSDENKPQEK